MNRIKKKALAVVGALALATGIAAGPAAAATSFVATAEDGTTAAFTDTLNATVIAGAAHNGSYGYRVTKQGSGGYLHWAAPDVDQGHRYASVSTWVKPISHDSTETLDLISIKNGNGVNHFDFTVQEDNTFRWDLLSSDNDATAPITLNTWHFVQAYVDFGSSTYTANVKIDGVDQGTISSTGQVPTDVNGVYFGGTTAKINNQANYDQVQFKVGDTSAGYLPDLAAGGVRPVVTSRCPSLNLKALVNPSGDDTSVVFQYGTTSAFGSTTGSTAIGSGSSDVTVTTTIAPPSTTTYYRAVATNSTGSTNGAVQVSRCTSS